MLVAKFAGNVIIMGGAYKGIHHLYEHVNYLINKLRMNPNTENPISIPNCIVIIGKRSETI